MRLSSLLSQPLPMAGTAHDKVAREAIVPEAPAAAWPLGEPPEDLDQRVRQVGEWQVGEWCY